MSTSTYIQKDTQAPSLKEESSHALSLKGEGNGVRMTGIGNSLAAQVQMNGRMHESERIRNAVPKYPKIQPAIAIKPKPVPVAVLPKPSGVNNRGFDSGNISSLKSDIPSCVNTSKRWVLPPRPRPGRKPTNCHSEEHHDSSLVAQSLPTNGAGKQMTKKRVKTNKGDSSYTSSSIMSSLIPEDQKSRESSRATPSPNLQLPESNDIINLKVIYLNKLKEQDMIRNYVEILKSQIQELRFVQSGVITSAALNTTGILLGKSDHENGSAFKSKAGSAFSQCEQLERINNINDLNKFLNYLTRSSSIIRSATKKYAGTNNSGNLNSQIEYYLEMRSKHKVDKRQISKTVELTVEVNCNKNKNHTKEQKRFVPSLLEPLSKIEEDFKYDFNYLSLENRESIIQQIDDVSKTVKAEMEDDSVLMNVLPEDDKPDHNARGAALNKGRGSFSCGFCTEDTCLCLETEADLAPLK